MAIYVDVITRLSRSAALEAARDAERIFGHLGRTLSDDMGKAFDFGSTGAVGMQRSMRDMQRETQRLADAQVLAAQRVESARMREATAQAKLNEATEKYSAGSSKALAAQQALYEAHARADRAQRNYTRSLSETTEAQAALSKSATDAAGSAGELGGALGGIGALARGVGPYGAVAIGILGIGDALTKVVPLAGQLQQSLVKLNTAADVPAAMLPQLQRQILTMAPQVGIAPSELMEGAYYAAKAGYRNPADMMAVLKAGAQMAAVEGVPLDVANSAITTQLSDYNMPASSAPLAASQIVAAAGAAKTTLSEYAGAMHIVEPVASKVGISAPAWMAMVSQMTQSGMHPDNAGQDVLHLIQKIQAPTAQMRAEWGAMGLDPMAVKEEFAKDPLGTLAMLNNAVNAHTDKNGLVNVGADYKNQQLTQSLTQMVAGMTPAERAIVDQIKNGSMTYKEWRRSRGHTHMDELPKISEWWSKYETSKGYSALLASGQGTQQTHQQAIQALVGDQVSGQAFQQLAPADANAKAVATQKIIEGAHPTASGDVAGSSAALHTYAGDVKRASAAWQSLKVSMGEAALPTVTSALNAMDAAMTWIVAHRHAIGTAISALVNPAHELQTCFAALKVSIPATFRPAIDDAKRFVHWLGEIPHVSDLVLHGFKALAAAHPFAGLVHGVEALLDHLRDIPGAIAAAVRSFGSLGAKGFGAAERFLHIPGHASGGPIGGDGPDGVDSVLMYGAPGEHMWTAPEVAAAGGHGALYRLRALALAGGLRGYADGGPPGSRPGGLDIRRSAGDPKAPLGTRQDPIFVKAAEKHSDDGRPNRGVDATPGPGNDGMGASALSRNIRGGDGAALPRFGADLPSNFGLGEGLPGIAKWLVMWLGDMGLAAGEGAMAGSLLKPPNGTDTQLSWLAPGEYVEPKAAVDRVGTRTLDKIRHAKAYRAGGATSESEPESGAAMGSTGGAKPGMSVSGGALGAAEGAAAAGADMLAPGSGAAVQILSQIANRTISWGGQMVASGVEGFMSSFMPSDNALSDFGNTLPGKILSGIAGAKPASPVVAGNTQAPLKDSDIRDGPTAKGDASTGTHIHMYNPKIEAQNTEQLTQQLQRKSQMAVGGVSGGVAARGIMP